MGRTAIVSNGSIKPGVVWYDNREELKELGVYQESLLYAWSQQEISGYWSNVMRISLLLFSNREKLSILTPIPSSAIKHDGTITVYRDVQKLNREQIAQRREYILEFKTSRKFGLSWTIDIGTARRFTQRYSDRGVVYRGRANPQDICAYIDSDGKKQGCLIPYARKMKVEMAEQFTTTKNRCHIPAIAGRSILHTVPASVA